MRRRVEVPFILGQANVLEVKLQQLKSPSTFVQELCAGRGRLEGRQLGMITCRSLQPAQHNSAGDH